MGSGEWGVGSENSINLLSLISYPSSLILPEWEIDALIEDPAVAWVTGVEVGLGKLADLTQGRPEAGELGQVPRLLQTVKGQLSAYVSRQKLDLASRRGEVEPCDRLADP